MALQASPMARWSGSISALLAVTIASSAMAQAPLSAEEFEAYTEGRTLFFSSGGQPYGAERYKPGRQVVWSFLDGECQNGTWYESGPNICFVYENNPDSPQCWTFFRDGAGLRGVYQGLDGGTTLYEAQDAGQDMVCLGPEIGV